jgi:tRNA pseudouridine55 synthase
VIGTKQQVLDRNINGILLLDKPQGLSSNAALQQARRLFRARKAGHAGSLDPLATGMLPVCFGEATKVCDYLLGASKSYRFTAKLGQQTDSGDADGQVIAESAIPTLTESQVLAVFAHNLGQQQQVPPMYSALKHQGERLYELARRGEVIEREARSITLHRLNLLRLTATDFEAEVRCSKGTYVRTLAEDLAKQLGTLAHLTALRRTTVEPFDTDRMLTLEQLAEFDDSQREALLLPMDVALIHLTPIHLTVEQQRAISQGKVVRLDAAHAIAEVVRLYGADEQFLGVGQIELSGELRSKRLLATSTLPDSGFGDKNLKI